MQISIKPGTYVVAVSGGVDSMALLHMLTQKVNSEARSLNIEKNKKSSEFGIQNSKFRFIVAHFDHGIRQDSKLDRQLAQQVAETYNLPFVYDEGKLGPNSSEETARKARYRFLRKVSKLSKAQGIITAHHQDDALETAIINWLRGTGRRGYTALRSQNRILRPLLNIPKQELVNYARLNNLEWREDSTNKDTKYLRNLIRERVMPQLTAGQRKMVVDALNELRGLNDQIDQKLVHFLHTQPKRSHIDRHWFTMLPHDVALEVMAMWLRLNNSQFDTKLLERLVAGAKTLSGGKQMDVDKNSIIEIKDREFILKHRER